MHIPPEDLNDAFAALNAQLRAKAITAETFNHEVNQLLERHGKLVREEKGPAFDSDWER